MSEPAFGRVTRDLALGTNFAILKASHVLHFSISHATALAAIRRWREISVLTIAESERMHAITDQDMVCDAMTPENLNPILTSLQRGIDHGPHHNESGAMITEEIAHHRGDPVEGHQTAPIEIATTIEAETASLQVHHHQQRADQATDYRHGSH